MTPVLANVSFGIYVLMPLGWVFMAAIIGIEIVVLSRFLGGVWWHKKAAVAAVVANLVSGAVGLGLSLFLNGGWWLVVWMPWVSSHEVDFSRHFAALSVYYAAAFVLSVGIEGVVEQRMLRSQFEKGKIWKACIFSNAVSYIIGGVGMYSWSFGLWR
jgi:hypothetical protein